jgi:hypothetical protein
MVDSALPTPNVLSQVTPMGPSGEILTFDLGMFGFHSRREIYSSSVPFHGGLFDGTGIKTCI